MKIIVGISDARYSRNADDILVTYSLGSCIGATLYDPVIKIGGLIHYQLPSGRMDSSKADKNPLMFADTGLTLLLNQLLKMGAHKKRLQVKVAGGAQMMGDAQMFNIGKRNYNAARQFLWKNGLFIDGEAVGGGTARNLSLDMNSGIVLVKSKGQTQDI